MFLGKKLNVYFTSSKELPADMTETSSKLYACHVVHLMSFIKPLVHMSHTNHGARQFLWISWPSIGYQYTVGYICHLAKGLILHLKNCLLTSSPYWTTGQEVIGSKRNIESLMRYPNMVIDL